MIQYCSIVLSELLQSILNLKQLGSDFSIFTCAGTSRRLIQSSLPIFQHFLIYTGRFDSGECNSNMYKVF